MFNSMQFAAAAASWAMRNGVCAERVGLTIAQNGRYALTNVFNLFAVSLEEELPHSFFASQEEAKAYAYEALENGLLADVLVYVDGNIESL